MKGQASMETIILLGFIILMTIPILMIFFSIDRTTPALGQARASVQIIADHSNRVYAQGSDTQIITTIAVPQYCKKITIQDVPGHGGQIIFHMWTADGDIEVYQKTYAPLEYSEELTNYRKPSPDSFLTPGLQRIKISLVDGATSGEKVIKIEPY
ncbi:hypothetical protein KO465_01210 [Candidatus Micrarchaeota archaeon]|nr:hypothetical protein [Candidatus Micrarchaeota archaeon]